MAKAVWRLIPTRARPHQKEQIERACSRGLGPAMQHLIAGREYIVAAELTQLDDSMWRVTYLFRPAETVKYFETDAPNAPSAPPPPL